MNKQDHEIQKVKNIIDDYLTTVYAIVGFLNTYKFEMEKLDKEIILFQGRKLFLNKEETDYVTPDLGLTIEGENNLVGEVKYSFPAEKELWLDTFNQIKKYENILGGWPNNSEAPVEFDIVLLVQQSRSRSVIDYYLNTLTDEQKLKKTFAILEFNRSSQGKEYFHFRLEYGNLSNEIVKKKLFDGLYVPYDLFITKYSTIKIYDCRPPIPLLLQLIYDVVIDQLKADGNYKKLTKKTRVNVNISTQRVTAILREAYSFKSMTATQNSKGQPEYPKQEWVRDAFDKLAEINEGKWIDKSADIFSYILTQKENSILDHYIRATLGNTAMQQELFE